MNSPLRLSGAMACLLTVVATSAMPGCNGKASCPPHGRMVTGASCNGDTLQCAYEVPVYNCDGTIGNLESSCSCDSGKWSCPAVVEPVCPVDTPIETGGQGGADSGTSTSTTGLGGSTLYNTTAAGGTTAATTRSRASNRPSSCPLIYVWNGSGFQYETELGGLTLNIPAEATANRAIPIPGGGTFYALLPHAKHDPEQGLEIRLRESVGEITYLDEAKLILVDHPEGTEVWSSGDESTNEWGYVNPFTLHTGMAPRLPNSAVDRTGKDVLKSLLEVDNRPAPVVAGLFDNDYTLDFGPISSPENAKLVIDGWSIYLFFAPEDIQPFVEAELPDGSWVEVTKFGAPYGDFKSIAVDLSGKLPAGAQKLRVHLGLEKGARWVIDRVRLDESKPVEVKTTVLEASVADLLHRGRATLNRPSLSSRQDALDDENPDELIQLGYGAFTRYGDVRELLQTLDNKFVVMRHGDQITFTFPGAPPPPAGWVRSVVFQTDVMMKTFFFDKNVEQMPFHGMTQYPYPDTESYPTDAQHQQYLKEYNTRVFPAPSK